MDERKKVIRELEDKKQADADAKDRLLEGLGESLFQRMGEADLFPADTGNTPAGIVTEYRRLQKEIADSGNTIGNLEADIQRLKELDDAISAKEGEKVRLEKEITEVYILMGKALLDTPEPGEFNDPLRLQKESLLARIGEQENKIRELEEREGGILAWLGKSAQMAVSRALLAKNRSALERVYHTAGERFLSAGKGTGADRPQAEERDVSAAGQLDGEAAEKAGKLKMSLSLLDADLSGLKAERRKISDFFSIDGSPSQRIQRLEKHISHVKGELPAVCLRLGSFAAEGGGKEALSSILTVEDGTVLDKVNSLNSRIAEWDLTINKTRTSINIDNEKIEIEKTKKAILNQRVKIAAANDAISDLEKQIAESEHRIEEWQAFLRDNE